ncbi:hypothetical protein Scep_007137 [Stephania cephalantha]|uniref:Uncharacterized protein n=1 Tax=Stephania cephalantha TaxID=152367 RepID=A0AAP0KBZ4_9MAGN
MVYGRSAIEAMSYITSAFIPLSRDRDELYISVEGMARTKNIISREEIGAQELKGARGGDNGEEGQSGDKDGEGSESGEDEESGEEEDEDDDNEEVEEVVEKRADAKGRGKAKPRTPKGEKLADDPSTSFSAHPNPTYVGNLPRVSRWIVKSEQGLNIDHVQRLRRALDTAQLNKRVRRAVEFVTAWKALPPRLGDKASAVKMVDEVLKHLTMIGSSGTSGTTTSSGTQSQPATSKRKATTVATGPSKTKGKKSKN